MDVLHVYKVIKIVLFSLPFYISSEKTVKTFTWAFHSSVWFSHLRITGSSVSSRNCFLSSVTVGV